MNDHKVKSIVKSLSNIQSDNFFEEICLALGQAIDADYVFIATIDENKNKASSIAVARKGQIVDNFSYHLQNTPCSEVANESICTHRDNIQQLYPNDQLLVDMDIEGYVGVPLKTGEGKVQAILIALFEGNFANVIEVETLFLLFSGIIERELHKANYVKTIELHKHIIENTHEAILICDKEQRITYVNPAFTRMTGYSLTDVLGQTPKLLNSGIQDKNFYQAMWRELNEKGYWKGKIWNKNKEGKVYLEWLSITAIVDEHKSVTHYNAVFMDVTEQYRAAEKIKFQESYDELTKVANKNSLFDFINLSAARYQHQHPRSAALLVINIDLFKKFNSLYSYGFGDKVLVEIAARLKSVVQPSDLVARTSSDNFAIFVNDLSSKDDITKVINKVRSAFIEPLHIASVSLKITVTIGVAFLYKDASDAHRLFEKAEQAMFVAKDISRNSYQFYSQQLADEASKEEQLKQSLEYGIEHDEFSIVYQPIVSVEGYAVTKFEALIRWHHNGSWLSPADFIPTAEKFGLISKIGDIVLEKACAELSKLKAQGFTELAFNINRSIYEFPVEANDTAWLDTIRRHELEPKDICFELTESVLAPENDTHIALLNQLQLAGCTIALDDFGTGYSSLSYLRRFPIDTLKIDRSFISEMTKVEGDVVLVSAIISMAKALNIAVVAEGVELKGEVDILRQLGCDYIQGYYFSKPLKPAHLAQYLMEVNSEGRIG